MILAILPFIMPVFIGAISMLIAVLAPQIINYCLSLIPDLTGTSATQVMQFSGFAAWVAEKLKFDICLVVIVTWLQIRLLISAIPFIGRFVS